MIEAILFDFDGVLTLDKTGSLTTCRYLSKVTGIEFEKVARAFKRFNLELTTGRLTHQQIWPEICSSLEANLNFEYLSKAFESTPINTAMLNLATRLRGKYRIGIVTDNKKDRIDFLRTYFKLDEIFETISVSSEVGSGKEDAAIFLQATRAISTKPEKCVFIDNQLKNLDVPTRLGMKTIFHDDTSNDVLQTESKLVTLGVRF